MKRNPHNANKPVATQPAATPPAMDAANMSLLKENIVGVVLAGGLGRRMGQVDKPLVPLAGKPLIEHVLDRAQPQCAAMVINANGDPGRFQKFSLPVVADSVEENPGPLAGILAGLDWAALHQPHATHVLSLPGDAPFIPQDLVSRLVQGLGNDHYLARAHSFGRRHPVVGLWPIEIRSELRDQLVNHDTRKIDRFTADYTMAEVEFDGIPDPFFNINTPEDHANAERVLKS